MRVILPRKGPVEAPPPACSMIMAMGKPSYRMRSLPLPCSPKNEKTKISHKTVSWCQRDERRMKPMYMNAARHKQIGGYLCHVGRIHVDAPIHQGAVHIRDHGPHITRTVRLGLLLLEVVDGLLHGRVPGEVVALVDGVDQLTVLWDHHLLCCHDELADRRIQSVALYAVPVGKHKLSGATICAIASTNNLPNIYKIVSHFCAHGRNE
jgi:hypothetical protein